VIHHGDNLEVMAAMEPESVDAIVTDPPYNLSFMAKTWDRNLNHGPWAEAAYRVAKPSAYLLAFGGTRTVHRLTCALEDAGWIIRDTLVWAYASGFPKSKASLKPAWEPIVMVRKPGPLRELAIDLCRIGVDPSETVIVRATEQPADLGTLSQGPRPVGEIASANPAGRWPANVILTDDLFSGGVEGVVGGGTASYNPSGVFGTSSGGDIYGNGDGIPSGADVFGYGDTGTYSRFFIIPKSDRTDREPVLGIGGEAKSGGRVNVHPT
jgi:hypothetical protein